MYSTYMLTYSALWNKALLHGKFSTLIKFLFTIPDIIIGWFSLIPVSFWPIDHLEQHNPVFPVYGTKNYLRRQLYFLPAAKLPLLIELAGKGLHIHSMLSIHYVECHVLKVFCSQK
jgi:hypothetical protein